MSEYTADTDGLGVLRLLNAVRSAGLVEKTRFYQASTSELYGLVQEVPQRETVPDEVVRRAVQIELVDMPAEALRRRMAHGNVYTADQGANTVTRITPAGASSIFGRTGDNPYAIALSADGTRGLVGNYSGEVIGTATHSTVMVLDTDPESATFMKPITWLVNL